MTLPNSTTGQNVQNLQEPPIRIRDKKHKSKRRLSCSCFIVFFSLLALIVTQIYWSSKKIMDLRNFDYSTNMVIMKSISISANNHYRKISSVFGTNNNETNVTKDGIDIHAIVKKWELVSSKETFQLLQQQITNKLTYHENSDFIYFFHLLKTGGTTLSMIMEKAFGKENILPGSAVSGHFQFESATNELIRPRNRTHEYSVSFSHSRLRPTIGHDISRVASFIDKHAPSQRKKRLVMMIRDPIAFRASHMFMWMCGMNKLVKDHNKEREKRGHEPQCGMAVNLTSLVDLKISEMKQKCNDTSNDDDRRKHVKRECSELQQGIDPLKHCRSPRHLLESDKYHKVLHNMYHIVMGKYTQNETGYYAPGAAYESPSLETIAQVEQYTLSDLGGLTPNRDDDEADFLWFGVTERMSESMCLFYYTFRITPAVGKTPQARIMKCRPTDWWTDDDKRIVHEREPLDYAVFRAANAIMDVRLARMRREIRDRLEAGESLEDMPYVADGCYEGA